MVRTARTILFVYDMRGGIASVLRFAARRGVKEVLRPCTLFVTTHSRLGLRKEWSDFLRGLPFDSEFMKKDAFMRRFSSCCSFPVVFLRDGDDLRMLLSSREINKVKSEEELEVMLRMALKDAVGANLVSRR